MRFAPYQNNTIYTVISHANGISHKVLIFREYGQQVGEIYIGDDPEDFSAKCLWTGYESVVSWVANNWKDAHKAGKVKSILDVPALDIKYDEM